MEPYSDSDTSSESEYESDEESTTNLNCDEDGQYENVEPEPSVPVDDEFESSPWTPEAQLKAQINAAHLAQLHAEIKARAKVPNPSYPKLPRSWPPRPFDVRPLPDYVQDPIHYFELFWTSEVWNTLVENTNAYAQYKEARYKKNFKKKSRWWKPVTLYEMRIFIALLIYMSIVGTLNIKSYWSKDGNTIYKPMASMKFFRFEQIKLYFHVLPVPPSTMPSCLPSHSSS